MDDAVVLAFMPSPLASGGATRADQSGRRASFNVADYEEPPAGRVANGDKAILFVRVIGVGKGCGQRSVKDGHGFVE